MNAADKAQWFLVGTGSLRGPRRQRRAPRRMVKHSLVRIRHRTWLRGSWRRLDNSLAMSFTTVCARGPRWPAAENAKGISMLNDANALGVLTILAKLNPTKGGRKGKAGIGGRATIEADNVYEGGVELTEQTFDDKNVRAGFRINVRGAKCRGGTLGAAQAHVG